MCGHVAQDAISIDTPNRTENILFSHATSSVALLQKHPRDSCGDTNHRTFALAPLSVRSTYYLERNARSSGISSVEALNEMSFGRT